MKILRILPAMAIACLAVSCQNSGDNSLSESASQTDSLMYYLGQINGADYLRDAERDTTLRETSNRQAYLSGIRAGLNALREGNDAYNRGVMLGMNMAMQMISFSDNMGVEIDKNAYLSSISATVMADTLPNVGLAQTEFRKVQHNIEVTKMEKDAESSRLSLKQAAQKASLPEITEDLYGKATNKTDGAQLTDEDDVNVTCEISKENGESMNLPLPPTGKIGNQRMFPEIISKAMVSLKSGETGEFMTTAHALLGLRAKQLGLEPNDVLKIKVTPTLVPSEEKKEDAQEAK